MTKANELRIGNLINYATYDMSNGNNILVPVVVDVNIIKAIELSQDLNVYHPIQLSQDILERVGFEKDEDGVYKYGNVFYWIEGKLQIAINHTPIISTPCEYLHHLQNVIFFSTGNELDVKL